MTVAICLMALAAFAGSRPGRVLFHGRRQEGLRPMGRPAQLRARPRRRLRGRRRRAGTSSGGAKAVAGNETYYLNSAADETSLALPAGSSAGSPPVCMAIDTPVFRMVGPQHRRPASQLRVTASYKLLGLVRTQTIATVTAAVAWAPTRSRTRRFSPWRRSSGP